MKSPIYQFFIKTPPFSLLPKKEIEAITKKTTIDKCVTGAILSVQDETTIENVYIVKTGYLEIYYKKEGRKTIKNAIKTLNHIFLGALENTTFQSADFLETIKINKEIASF